MDRNEKIELGIRKNQSQLRDLALSSQSRFEKMIGRKSNFFSYGIETSLGHAYSTYLEVASRNDFEVKVDVFDFLSFVGEHMRSHGEWFEAENLGLDTKVCDPIRTNAVYRFMCLESFPNNLAYKVMEDIYGPEKVPSRFLLSD
ncbi:MAG: hypothetical protein KC589_02900 [Nanoarchaeota archaeon]|nr:hypothetical protein [Nanoarchaeota archaeon]